VAVLAKLARTPSLRRAGFLCGFTLVELLVVIAILGVLAAIGTPIYTGYVDSMRTSQAQNTLRLIYLSQIEYHSDNGEYFQSGSACSALSDHESTIEANLLNSDTIEGDQFIYCIEPTENGYNAYARKLADTDSWYRIDQKNTRVDSNTNEW
jgi:prepilin-type N-terminal cleavage/methylation domain-containing protein